MPTTPVIFSVHTETDSSKRSRPVVWEVPLFLAEPLSAFRWGETFPRALPDCSRTSLVGPCWSVTGVYRAPPPSAMALFSEFMQIVDQCVSELTKSEGGK